MNFFRDMTSFSLVRIGILLTTACMEQWSPRVFPFALISFCEWVSILKIANSLKTSRAIKCLQSAKDSKLDSYLGWAPWFFLMLWEIRPSQKHFYYYCVYKVFSFYLANFFYYIWYHNKFCHLGRCLPLGRGHILVLSWDLLTMYPAWYFLVSFLIYDL